MVCLRFCLSKGERIRKDDGRKESGTNWGGAGQTSSPAPSRQHSAEMKILTTIFLALSVGVIGAQSENDNPDDQALKAAAKKAFEAGS